MKFHLVTLVFATVVLIYGTSAEARMITALNTPVTENFDTLASSGAANTAMPPDWSFVETGTGANTTYAAGTGSSFTGNTYSFGATGNAERALGGLPSDALQSTFGALFTNKTGVTINDVTIGFVGEQWRVANINKQRLDFQYSTDPTATGVTTGTWVDFNALDFESPITSATASALNGNDSANQRLVSATIRGLSIVNGDNFRIRFFNSDPPTGSGHGLAVDNFSLDAAAVPEPSSLMLSILGMVIVLGFRRRSSLRIA